MVKTDRGDLRAELNKTQFTSTATQLNLEEQLREMRADVEQFSLENTRLKSSHDTMHTAMIRLQKDNSDLKNKLENTVQLLDQVQNKYNMQKDMNTQFRKFYARNIISHMNKDEFDRYVEEGFKDFGQTLSLKNSFIMEELGKLERLADKTSSIPEHLKYIICPDLDQVVEKDLAEQKEMETRLKELNRPKLN